MRRGLERCGSSAALAVLLMGGVQAAQAGPRQIYERQRGSVVAVTYYVETRMMRQVREVEGRDLAVVVGTDLIMLNGAVVTSSATGAQPHDFKVHFGGGVVRNASFVGRDEFANIAFLRLQGTLPPGVQPLRFDVRSRPHVGDDVYVLGLLPDNLEPMVHLAAGRVVADVDKPKPFLVTDLNAEDALGGPVFDADGRAVGVLSELGGAGPSFVSSFGGEEGSYYGILVPSATLAPLIASPPRKGEARRAWLGITLQALTPEMADYWKLPAQSGIIVNSVIPGSPAAVAGLQEGDIILEMNGAPVPVDREDHVPIFVEQVGLAGVATQLHLGIVRGGSRQEVDVVLQAAPKSPQEAEEYHNNDFELTVRELVFADLRAHDLAPDFRGVMVSRVEEGSWSSVGGLEAGDIIQRVDDETIAAPADVKRVLEDAAKKEIRKLVFFVERDGRSQFITVKTDWQG
ncbi:MAG TPA: PDZ domain-containing protein [Candidatus Krumholzibacteria bacterium]|nr:PDZ domain-containing protein [Candidatus Krumholzibacteria bacterium]